MNIKLKILVLISLIILRISSMAQINLTASGSNPYIGYSSTTATNAVFSPGSAGTAQTYDFGNVLTNGIKNTQYVAVSSTPFSSQFPNASLASTDGATYTYYNISNNALSIVGSALIPSGPVISYSNGEDILRYPFLMGSFYTDQFTASYNNGNQIYRNGFTTVTGDGTGILILPNATYMNVLRIRVLRTYKDSSASSIYNYYIEEYLWYKEGIKEPLATKTSYSFTDGLSTYSFQDGSFTSSTVGVEESNARFPLNLFPNPTSEYISILLNDKNISNAKVKIINQLGQDVSSIESVNFTNGNNVQIDVSYLKNGFYTVQLLLQDNSIINKRFAVNK